jgi:hypothetical protein
MARKQDSRESSIEALAGQMARGLRAAVDAELRGPGRVADDAFDQAHGSDSTGTSTHTQGPHGVEAPARYTSRARPAAAALRAAGEEAFDQAHSSGGSGGSLQDRVGLALRPVLQQELRAAGVIKDGDDMFDQSHSSGGSGGGGSIEERLSFALKPVLQAEMRSRGVAADEEAPFDQSHSAGVTDAVRGALERGVAVRDLAAEEAPFDQSHSAGVMVGELEERVAFALRPVLQQELRASGGAPGSDEAFDQAHSSGGSGGGSLEERVANALQPVLALEIQRRAT